MNISTIKLTLTLEIPREKVSEICQGLDLDELGAPLVQKNLEVWAEESDPADLLDFAVDADATAIFR